MKCPHCGSWCEQRQSKSGTVYRCIKCGKRWGRLMMRWQDWLPDERDEYDRWLAERIRQQTRGARTFAYLIAVALCIAMLLGR